MRAAWLEPLLRGLHDGTLFGFAAQIFMTLVGLIPLLLAWTGMVRWSRRRTSAGRPVATAARSLK